MQKMTKEQDLQNPQKSPEKRHYADVDLLSRLSDLWSLYGEGPHFIQFQAVLRGTRRFLTDNPENMTKEDRRRIVGTLHYAHDYKEIMVFDELIPFTFETRVLPDEPLIGLETIMIEQILSLFQTASEGNIAALVRGQYIHRRPAIEYGIFFPQEMVIVHEIRISDNWVKGAYDK